MTVGGYEGTTLSNAVLATFVDTGTQLPAANYAATIDWGDGKTTAGTVSIVNGTFQATGSHVYADEGNFPLVVTVTETGGAVGIGRGKAAILEALLADGTRGTANDRWVNEIYGDSLGRQADSGALGYWSGLVAKDANRNLIASAIESSDEYRGRQVEALFQTYLHRSADPGASAYFLARLAAGATCEDLAAVLIGSDEYLHYRGGGTSDGFLDALYQDVLGRSVDSGARVYFDKQLAAGAPRSRIAAVLLSSDEYRQLLVQRFYQHYLDHDTTSGSTSFWLAYMKQGGRDEQVIADIVGSDEFFQKTAP
ncbi:MAG TPA: DUF4214 domain-containing protein [Thermomicrobiales bacterium]|nr:DUF4214 domain-containing protein [Thermomicrobiales bacterium]